MTLAYAFRASRAKALGRLCLIAMPAFAGCFSATKYEAAPASTPPAVLLNRAFASAPLQATLTALIVYEGPGSWKREALWDEYVVTLHNTTAQPLTVTAAELTDFAGVNRASSDDPWQLETESQNLCKEYDRAGLNFVRSATPAVLTVGGIAAVAAATSVGSLTIMQGPLALVTVPTYLVARNVSNAEDRRDVETEFRLRRLLLPVTLAPGQTRAGCCFFPMVPNPRALRLQWISGKISGEAGLTLGFLHGLHMTPAPAGAQLPPAGSHVKNNPAR
jgi:hypothetical protein